MRRYFNFKHKSSTIREKIEMDISNQENMVEVLLDGSADIEVWIGTILMIIFSGSIQPSTKEAFLYIFPGC